LSRVSVRRSAHFSIAARPKLRIGELDSPVTLARGEDVVVAGHKSVTRIQTCGHIVIQPAGRVIAKLVQGQKGVDVQGAIEANVVTAGVVSNRPKAPWKGDCQAPGLSVKSWAEGLGLFAVAGADAPRLPGGRAELQRQEDPAARAHPQRRQHLHTPRLTPWPSRSSGSVKLTV